MDLLLTFRNLVFYVLIHVGFRGGDSAALPQRLCGDSAETLWGAAAIVAKIRMATLQISILDNARCAGSRARTN